MALSFTDFELSMSKAMTALESKDDGIEKFMSAANYGLIALSAFRRDLQKMREPYVVGSSQHPFQTDLGHLKDRFARGTIEYVAHDLAISLTQDVGFACALEALDMRCEFTERSVKELIHALAERAEAAKRRAGLEKLTNRRLNLLLFIEALTHVFSHLEPKAALA